MHEDKPLRTGNYQTLPYDRLSPDKFEELCLWLVEREGFERAEHLGAAGKEQGRDIVAWLNKEQWAFQCKRVKSFTVATAKREIKKLFIELPQRGIQIPKHYVFISSSVIPSVTRDQIRQLDWSKEQDVKSQDWVINKEWLKLELYFWAVTELDAKVNKYPDIVKQFFQITSAPFTPHQIPPPPADFTGRDIEFDTLLKARKDGACIAGLKGIGGIGKSALAFALIEKLTPDYPDGQIMLDMLGTSQTPLSPVEAMRRVIQTLLPQERLSENETELKNLYLSVLHDKKLILLLDNARSRAQVEPLIPPKTCILLVTSRYHFTLPGLISWNLEALNPQSAIDLLLSIEPRLESPSPFQGEGTGVRVDASPLVETDGTRPEPEEKSSSASTLAALCEYIPLALRLSASALSEKPATTVAKFITQFKEAQSRLKLSGMDASLQVSYELLSPDLQTKLRLLSVFPAPFDTSAAADIWDQNEDTSETYLNSLVNASLLNFDEFTGFRLHDLVRDFAAAKLTQDESYTASLRHAAHYLEVALLADSLYKQGGDRVLECLHLFDLNWAHINQGQSWAASQPETDQAAAHLCNRYPDAALNCLALRLHPEKWITWIQSALAAACRLGKKEYQGIHLGTLGLAYTALGQVEKAIQYYQEALEIARETGARLREGVWLGSLGNAYYSISQVDKAIQYYQKARAIAHEIGDRQNEGAWLGSLGNAFRDLGEADKALQHFQQALIIARYFGDRRNEGVWLGNLGLAYADLSQYDKAIEHYQGALAIAREINEHRGVGQNLDNLGLAYADLGQYDKAIEHYQQALVIAHETSDRRGEGSCLGNLGLAYSNLGQIDKAIDYHQQALVISRETGDRRSEANHLGNLANAYEEQGNLARAVPLMAAALAIFTDIQSPSKKQAARILSHLRRKMGKKKFNAALAQPPEP